MEGEKTTKKNNLWVATYRRRKIMNIYENIYEKEVKGTG